MKANELRIGNWVMQGQIKSIVQTTETPMISVVKGELTGVQFVKDFFINELKPVSLAGNILGRFGWIEKTPDEWHLKDFHGFILSKPHMGGESFTAMHPMEKGAYVVKMHVKYVHELQNLYFAFEDREMQLQPQQKGPKHYPMSDEG